jgi:hypothetical protein
LTEHATHLTMARNGHFSDGPGKFQERERDPGMRSPEAHAQSLRSPLAGALAALLLLGYPAVRAESVSRASGDRAEHARVCDCGARCKLGTCCCGRIRTTRIHVSSSKTPPHAGEWSLNSRPCLNDAPCDNPGLPTAPPRGQLRPVAALDRTNKCRLLAAGDLLPPPASCRLPIRRGGRLDRPPKSGCLA